MFDKSDPRASLSWAAKQTATEFAGAEYAKFYETAPQESGREGKTWWTRGQNFIIALTEAKAGATFKRKGQIDEYVVLLPEKCAGMDIAAGTEKKHVDGYSLAFIPPGDGTITVREDCRVVRMFTTRSADLVAKCANAASYEKPHPNIPPFAAWPAPKGGFTIKSYTLDVPEEPGRFGRIWRCSTLMVNYLPVQKGPRDIAKLSPHHHDDFEQCSLALQGAYIHHLRWPWTPNQKAWRDDDHE